MQIKTIRAARIIAGKKQSEVAKELGVSTRTYRKWEQNPELLTIQNATKLAKFLEQTLDTIILLR